MIRKYFYLSLLLVLLFSCSKTSTPKEFMNTTSVPIDMYQNDVKYLEKLTYDRLDSISKKNISKGVYNTIPVSIIIDTIFYGPSNKVSYLSIEKRKNKYSKIQNPNNKEGIQYNGECYIGTKDLNNNSFTILKSLRYTVSSSEKKGYNTVLKSLRVSYLREMNYVDGCFNINDIRFWDSDAWHE